MLDPTTLFAWEPHVDQRAVHADTMIVTLGSYTDAGHTQRQTDEQLLQHLPNRLLGTFDADQLMDYAARRPSITFDKNHFSDYAPHRIALHLVSDTDGRDFLLLNGPEPSLQWERMAAAVNHLVDQLDVQHTVLVQTMPAPAPHTRPVVVTQYASDPALVSTEPVLGTFTLSASFTGVLTLRLGEAGHPVLGLLAHVPHYIADNDFPPAAAAVLQALQDATSLRLPADGLDLASALVRQQIDAQVTQSEELTAMVEAMEHQFDAFTEKLNPAPPAGQELPGAHEIPTAEEIGAKFEDFLAGLGEPGDDDPTSEDDTAG
ncbi:PAC2 family protein [Propioniciclava soli]|uniref:PAC2 family protein n=1 Tax=Propioniciclava soli TaxID=2775081 RepID=A0ABZ3CBY0_9ACTN|nr:PAC2 family protein [Propioniciclava soli]